MIFWCKSKGSTTYVEGATDKKRENYLKRHEVNEDWSKINPGSASAHILRGAFPAVNEAATQLATAFTGAIELLTRCQRADVGRNPGQLPGKLDRKDAAHWARFSIDIQFPRVSEL